MSGELIRPLVEILVPLSLPMLDDEKAPMRRGLIGGWSSPNGRSSADVLDRGRKAFITGWVRRKNADAVKHATTDLDS